MDVWPGVFRFTPRLILSCPSGWGLALIRPHAKTDVDGRGIFPDAEIHATLEDRMRGTDPEFEWVMKDVALPESH